MPPRVSIPVLRVTAASCVAIAAVLAAAVQPIGRDAAASADLPDVILIITDDQRADTMRYMPLTRRWLPTALVSAFASNPSCCPSRTSIMTGTYSHTNGLWTNGQGPDGSVARLYGGWPRYEELELDRRSVAFALQAAGYRTVHIGKFLNRFEPTSTADLPEGWDAFLAPLGRDELTAGTLGPYYEYTLVGPSGDGSVSTEPHGTAPADHSTRVLTDHAIAEIRSAGPQPLFLQLSYPAPHGRAGLRPPVPQVVDASAYVAPQRGSPAANEADVSDKPRYIQRLDPIPEPRLERWREATARVLYGVDRAIDRVLTAQAERDPHLTNTLVIFMSDNGFALGDHRWMTKGVPYEGATRIPMRISWPGFPAGRVEELVANVDVAATIAHVTGASLDATDGVSILDRARRYLVLEGLGSGRSFCGVRTAGRKFVTYETGEREYYNLVRDPFELHNGPRSAGAAALYTLAEAACASGLPPTWPVSLRY